MVAFGADHYRPPTGGVVWVKGMALGPGGEHKDHMIQRIGRQIRDEEGAGTVQDPKVSIVIFSIKNRGKMPHNFIHLSSLSSVLEGHSSEMEPDRNSPFNLIHNAFTSASQSLILCV